MKESAVIHKKSTLSKKSTIIFILLSTTVILIDSTIVNFFSSSGTEPNSQFKTLIFVCLSVVYGVVSILLLNSVKDNAVSPLFKTRQNMRYLFIIIASTQIVTYVIIALIVFQINFLSGYSLLLLRVQTYVSHFVPVLFLSSLIFLFFRWIFIKRNFVILLFSLALLLVCVNLMISLLFLELHFTDTQSPIVRPLTVVSYVISLGVTPLTEYLSLFFDTLSLASFLLMWLATVFLLRQYRYKIGKVRYYLITSIPLLYYVFPLHGYVGDIFFPMLISSPVVFAILYILIFSATKQVGAVFFGLTFWSASTVVYDIGFRKSLLITSIGITIVFSSIQLTPLQYNVLPPYGLITESYIPLGSFLLFTGIYVSAVQISRDDDIRKELYKSATSQLALLRNIGVSQMEKEMEDKVKTLQSSLDLDTTPYNIQELDEENAKKILNDVLNELYSKKAKQE